MIAAENLALRAGGFAIAGISFAVPDGGYAILMGRTGCGKTTLLETLCGLRPAAAGRILLGGRDATASPPGERGIGYVPQDAALFSSMPVRENLAFALRVRRWRRREIEARVGELAALLGIEKLLERRPLGLSGGEARRVALGRALAAHPPILCLDEPLSNLDDETHRGLCGLLKSIQTQLGVTILHVTHHRAEASELGEQIFEIRDGAFGEVSLPLAPAASPLPRRDP